MTDAIRTIFGDRASMIGRSKSPELKSQTSIQVLAIASDWREWLLSESEAPAAIGELIASVQLIDKGIRIALKVPIPSRSEGQPSTSVLRLFHCAPIKVKGRGVEMSTFSTGNSERLGLTPPC